MKPLFARRRPQVTVYSRQRCGLCRSAEQAVESVAGGWADITVVDIDADPAIRDRYTVRVPVVAVDGEEVAQYQVDERILRRRVRAAARRR